MEFFKTDKDIFKKMFITILFEDQENRVSWYADTPLADIKDALTCALESLCDSSYELLDFQAKPIKIEQISSFKDGSIYFLRRVETNDKNKELPSNNKAAVDSKRKLLVEIPALKHIESQVALKYMLTGSNLLKHTPRGYPHIRLFQISHDLKRILWYTKSKPLTDSQVSIESIKEIVYGQQSDNFLKYPLPMLEEFSFSLYYYNNTPNLKSLDITCKDQREFDLWIIGIKALQHHFENRLICKDDLLNHSKSYCEQVQMGRINNCSKYLIYNQDDGQNNKEKKLQKFIASRNINQKDMGCLILKLANKLKEQKNDIHDIMDEEKHEDNINADKDYQELFADEAIADDTETQKNKMCNLFSECESNLHEIIQEFLWYSKEHKLISEYNIDEDEFDDFTQIIINLDKYSNIFSDNKFTIDADKVNLDFFLKEMDIKLWKLEIDIENIGDIILRFSVPQEKGIFENLYEFIKKIT